MRRIRVDFSSRNLEEKINDIRQEFSKNECQNCLEFEFNLTRLNLISASKVALGLSSELVRIDSRVKINCLLKDNETLNILSPRKLKNIFLSVNLGEEGSVLCQA